MKTNKEIPILFSTEMVQAILAVRKTQTRRIIKFPKDYDGKYVFTNPPFGIKYSSNQFDGCVNRLNANWHKGDWLWVREQHYRFGHWEKNGITKTGKQKWKFVPVTGSDVYYEGDNLPEKAHQSRVKGKEEFNLLYKRLARFMPKSAARILLYVKSVRAEKLHDISPDDVLKEGVVPPQEESDLANSSSKFPGHFFELWDKINGPDSWKANPWVWVIEFQWCGK